MNRADSKTICPFLWDRVFIDVTGDVFFCCRKQPTCIGNIYNETLENIWNGETADGIRQMSISGSLECFEDCIMLTREVKRQGILPALKLKKIHLEHHEYCNIKCIMCYQKEIAKRRSLKNDVLLKNINFNSIEEVQLQGGEPLVYKPCVDLFLMLSQDMGVPVTLQTNGVLLNDEYIQVIAKHSDEIMIALNGASAEIHEKVNSGSSFVTVLENVNKLKKKRDELGSRLRIEGQMTMVKQNVHELPEFILLAEQLELDSISISWEASVPSYLRGKPSLFADIQNRLQDIEFWNKRIFIKRKHIERLCKLFELGC